MYQHRHNDLRNSPRKARRTGAILAAAATLAWCESPTQFAHAASKPPNTPPAGAPCRTVGQRAGVAPNQVICQRTSTKKLIWTRSTTSTSPTNAPASFQSRPSSPNVTSALALLNAQGAEGFAYIGPFAFDAASHELFVKVDRTTTYRYEAVEKTPDASSIDGFMSLLRTKGKEGLLYKGPALFPGDFTKTYLLFVRSSAKNTTYTYRHSAWPTDETAMVADLNANGAQGFAYMGDVIPDVSQPSAGLRLFAKNDKSTDTVTYALKPPAAERTQFLTEATTMGQGRAVWRGDYVFPAATPDMRMRSLYETSTATTRPVGYSLVTQVPTSIEELVRTANDRAKKGELFWGQYRFGAETVSVYVDGPLATLPVVGVVVP